MLRNGMCPAFLFLVTVVLSSSADDIDTLWSRLRASYLTGNSSGAAGHLSALRTDGSWADVDYADQSATVWKPVVHLQRVKAMSIAFSSPGNADYHSTIMLGGIESSSTTDPGYVGSTPNHSSAILVPTAWLTSIRV